ncbi:MAG: hypothetical protein Q6361_07465 [Candidatus Hermodarchaeota archaeon]|nr:hypothetical protein [Candidatus Hermodarchaeota archaeon]
MSQRVNTTTASKDKWTAIGVTVNTKDRFIAMKKAFEKNLDKGPQTWDYFLNALLDLGPLTWNFLIKESVKGIHASLTPCPLPRNQTSQSKEPQSG